MRNNLQRLGLALLAVLAAGDLATPFVTDGDHPPVEAAVLAAALGIATLVVLPAAWRGSRAAVLAVFGTRLLSAALTVPAFFVDGVPAAAAATGGAVVALTVAGVVLTMAGGRRVVTA